MDRTERFYKIEHLIRSRGCVSFAVLLEALEVSPATLKRDLAYLRERLDAPIEYDAVENGYRFGQQWRGGKHELPGVWFNEAELHALLTMQQMLAGLDDQGVVGRHLQPMFDKITGMLGVDAAEADELRRRVKLIGTARRRVASDSFETVGSAVVKRRRLAIRYRKKRDGVASEREVSPQRLVHHRHAWYLDAWCHASEGYRRFALDGIEAASLLETAAKPVPLDELEAELDQGYGIFAGGSPKQAELVFSAEAAAWVSREEWHPAQHSEFLPDGRWRLQLPYVDDTELLMDLLRHAGQVEVVGPPALREAHAHRLRQAVAAL
ncbi:helix-turn-helix transcriptional regulator [Roseateles puraquae]|uniref:Transcriptional regulator n=1 Tax=Roseateles puraquae TaxID=431059 RepID=A0A254N222_9BURK|nr:WYL domain-containing protein [Roseateles puraquae]MDG0856816.1 WYL domain-containing protein [Roseateles puraquae]OWR01920.1 transcriptional regulator [Roseateles puraquae]